MIKVGQIYKDEEGFLFVQNIAVSFGSVILIVKLAELVKKFVFIVER